MNINEITDGRPLTEDMILREPMYEMATMYPKYTGIPFIIYFGEVGGQNGPRIKVSNVSRRFARDDNFVIAVAKEPWVVTPNSVGVSKSILRDILDWVTLNYDDLMLLWEIHESGDPEVEDSDGNIVNVHELLARLKKV